jgi:hypothetical protein
MRWKLLCLVLACGLSQASTLSAWTDTAYTGRVDTIGGTTYDWQWSGPAQRVICRSPGIGTHVVWMFSACTSQTTYPDRNLRYNFQDQNTGQWNWIDADYMQSGVNVSTERCGYGNVAAHPQTGVALVPCHQGSPLTVHCARDVAPGAGIFEDCNGAPELEGYQWPVVAVTGNGWIHAAVIEDAMEDKLFYSRCTSWCSWSEPVSIPPPEPEPCYPDHNIAGSRQNRVCVTWVYQPGGYSRKPGYYRVSENGGTTWGQPTWLQYPPAFSGDTLPSFSVWSLFPFFDQDEVLHIAASVTPFLRDTNFTTPCEIWLWREDSAQWFRIHRADPESLLASVGYSATIACRPSIGEDDGGNLYVAWEEFDGVNVEPMTDRLRADIWAARSSDGGVCWSVQRLTGPGDTASNRFPCILDDIPGPDSVTVRYMQDLVAGFCVRGEGPATRNPIVVHTASFAGLEEERPRARARLPSVTFVRGVLTLHSGSGTDAAGFLLDVAGRKVAALNQGDNDVSHLGPGVYFVRQEGSRVPGSKGPSVRKIVIQR